MKKYNVSSFDINNIEKYSNEIKILDKDEIEDIVYDLITQNSFHNSIKIDLLVNSDERIKKRFLKILKKSVKNGFLPGIKIALEKKVININNSLSSAIKSGQLQIVKFLVENGADVHNNDGYSLIEASKNGHLDIVKYLIKKGVDVNSCHSQALINAVSNDDLSMVEFLVKGGIDIHCNDDYALKLSSGFGQWGIVKFLVENGANIHAENQKSLRWAEHNSHDNVVKYLKTKIDSSLSHINKIKNMENFIKKCNSLTEKEIEIHLRNFIDNTKLLDFDDCVIDLLLNNKKINKVLFKIFNDIKHLT